jgi:hypothetical protein
MNFSAANTLKSWPTVQLQQLFILFLFSTAFAHLINTFIVLFQQRAPYFKGKLIWPSPNWINHPTLPASINTAFSGIVYR